MTFFSLLDKGVPRRLMVHRFTSWPCHILSHLVTAPCRSRGAPPWRHSAALIRRSQMPSLPQNSFAHLSVSLETSVARIPSAHDEAIPQARVGVHALWRHIRWLAWGTRAQWAAPAPAPCARMPASCLPPAQMPHDPRSFWCGCAGMIRSTPPSRVLMAYRTRTSSRGCRSCNPLPKMPLDRHPPS